MLYRAKCFRGGYQIFLRRYSKDVKSEKLLNPQISFSGYHPKNFELKDVSSKTGQPGKEHKFSMLFPPPNITGDIHLGHALTATIQDAIIRWKHKQNIETIWIPGTDHAGIATQVIVDKMLFHQENKKRLDLGKKAFLEVVKQWQNEKQSSIKKDLKMLGTSFDWEYEYFTMDSNLSDSVNEAFIRLFERDLIFRDATIINWSCALESAISDIEVENIELCGKTEIELPNYSQKISFGEITDIAYKIVDSDDEIIVSTTRPETMLGDVAVAVNPNDQRYNHHLPRKTQLWHPFRNESIPLIFDDSVDPSFGTGALKITPAHDKEDYKIAKTHNLNIIQVINEKGLIMENFEHFGSLKRFTARDKIISYLNDIQLYRGKKSHKMSLPICSRSKDIIEFLLKPQWFLNCSKLSQRVCEVVKTKELKIHPNTFETEWFRWMENCHDWCISRQLWWGHQIPAYKMITPENKTSDIWVAAKSSEEAKEKFRKMNAEFIEFDVKRDSDVLDTWFSSCILPLSVFNWPNQSKDFEKFFPLSLMETGHDILFFWVARMVMLSLELTDRIPFKEVLLHGVIRDFYGRKMSKSLGNVIFPRQIIHGATLEQLEEETKSLASMGVLTETELHKSLAGQKIMYPKGIEECGIDALRLTLCSYNIKQHYISFNVSDCSKNKRFLNKIFNAIKFAMDSSENAKVIVRDIEYLNNTELSDMDLWLLSRLGNTTRTVKNAFENYNFHIAVSALKQFFYKDICDVYIEAVKVKRNNIEKSAVINAQVLSTCLAVGLDLMEPFTPYFSREMREFTAKNCDINPELYINEMHEDKIGKILEICKHIREFKAHYSMTKNTSIIILIKSLEFEECIKNNVNHIKMLTSCDAIGMTNDSQYFEKEPFFASSTAGPLCSFGLKTSTPNLHEDPSSLNKKKIQKLTIQRDNLLKIINTEGYQKSASEKKQKILKEKLEKMNSELLSLKEINEPLDTQILQSNIDKLITYAQTNNLTLNAKKCIVTSFSRKQSSLICAQYHIEGEELERKISTRDLGVIYDHKLNFNDHISYISGKARKMLGFIIRNGKYFKDANTFITLYNSLVRSNIEYASVIWNPHTQLQTNKLESIQHKFLRFLAFKCLNKKDDSLNYSEIEKRFKMDNLELRRKIADVKFTKK
ncbi:CLUMA_CG000141, isoform A [Clunio marinus]|uniref:valine--tRNA ligase n=1 Tax=Clunio marinus TaxID=568069 RepID=A0A1J1HIQ4_9DIPT|nr:CLUMA_CG000141, isoform A [Clunio marinus]